MTDTENDGRPATPGDRGRERLRDPLLTRRCIAGGALLMLLAVVLGAFGAHALPSRLTPQQLASYQTGVTYQQWHALGLVMLGIVAHVTGRSPWLARGAALFFAGTVFFSGSIYAMTFGAPRWLGAVAPVGGVAFMAGWVCLALHARRAPATGTTQ